MGEDNDYLNDETMDEDMDFEEESEAPKAGCDKAIVSLVLGLVGLIPQIAFLCGIIGLIFGIVSLRKHEPGRKMAIAGVVLGIVDLIWSAVCAVIVIGIGILFSM